MIDNAVFGEPTLPSNAEIGVVAQGAQYELPSDGGPGGPTAAELRIEEIFLNWEAPLQDGDQWTSYMTNDAVFWDEDHNGYYDHLQISGESGVLKYEPEGDCWYYVPYAD